MPKIDLVEELKQRFLQPLSGSCSRRVVVWRDVEGEFAQQFEQLLHDGFDGAGTTDGVMPAGGDFERPIRFIKARDGVMFETKRLIACGDTTSDLLVYRPEPADSLESDWLADVELYAEQFRADFLSLLAAQIGAPCSDDIRDALREHKAFFAAKDRVRKFSQCMPQSASVSDIELGMLAALLGGSSPADASLSYVVRAACAVLLHKEPETLAELLGKYDAEASLNNLVKRRLGFEGSLTERDSLEKFASYLLLSAASGQAPEVFSGLASRFANPQYARYCVTVVRDWMQTAGDAAEDLYEACSLVEGACRLHERLDMAALNDILGIDVLPYADEAILANLFDSFSNGADRVADAREVLQVRRGLRWHNRVACYYDLLDALATMQEFQQQHAAGFHIAQPSEVWAAYTSDWWHMDAAYRHMCTAFEACKLNGAESIDEPARKAAAWGENLYTNWYLTESNTCWSVAARKQWTSCGHVEGVERQDEFYWQVLPAYAGGDKTCVVLISDALRYEVAQDVATALERERGGAVSCKSMQAEFPSVTEMGMPALLPHQKLTLSPDTAAVLADGLPTTSTQEREAALKVVEPTARALRTDDYLEMPAAERRTLLKESKLVYLYHNKIDATGEKLATESDVFEACEDTAAELVSIAQRICTDAPSARVVITADHGFLYTREAPEEYELLAQADLPQNPLMCGKRHMVVELEHADALSDAGPLDRIALDVLGSYVGLAPRGTVRIKRAGGTRRYVHGGLSLQELCVPVVGYYRVRSGSKEFEETTKAALSVLSKNRRITNTVFKVELIQTEPVCGKTLPCVYELCMTDESGTEISDVVRVHADRTSEDASQRVISARFSLKAGADLSSAHTFSLVARDAETGSIAWHEDYKIDVAFAPLEGFDF